MKVPWGMEMTALYGKMSDRGKLWKRSGEITQIGLGLDKEIDQVGETQRPIMGKPVRKNGEVEGVVTGGV
jgi:hypothetical protein